MKAVLSLILFFSILSASAQNPQKAYKLYLKKEYANAYLQASKVKYTHKNKTPADYYRFFSALHIPNKLHPTAYLFLFKNLDKKLINAPHENYVLWQKKFQCDSNLYISKRNQYLQHLSDSIVRTNNFELSEKCLSVYPILYSYRKLADYNDSVRYSILLKSNNLDDYADFLEKIPIRNTILRQSKDTKRHGSISTKIFAAKATLKPSKFSVENLFAFHSPIL